MNVFFFVLFTRIYNVAQSILFYTIYSDLLFSYINAVVISIQTGSCHGHHGACMVKLLIKVEVR